jgi:hypothetical protein
MHQVGDKSHSVARRRLLNTLSTGLAGGLIGTTATSQAEAHKIEHVVDKRVVERTSQNISKLLITLSTDFQASLDNLMTLRMRIFNDVVQLFNALDPDDRGCLLSILTLEVGEQIGRVSPEAAPHATASSAITVGLGQQDLSKCRAIGVQATAGNVTVGAGVCPEHDLSGVQGGGFWASFGY